MHRVVIVGGGFGGLYAARALARTAVEVVLVDRRNCHLYQPLLYQVPSTWTRSARLITRHDTSRPSQRVHGDPAHNGHGHIEQPAPAARYES